MHRLKLICAALIATFALGAVASATALAEEGGNPLILATFPLAFTSESEKGIPIIFESVVGAKVECEKESGSGEFTSGRLGNFTMHLKGCKEGKHTCKTAGAESGEIVLAGADIHLVDIRINNVLTLGLWILPLQNGKTPVTVECETVKIKIRGSVLSTLEPEGKVEEKEGGTLLVLTKHVFSLWKETKGKQQLTECNLDKEFCFEGEKAKKFSLESEFGLGFEQTGLSGHAYLLFSVIVHIVY